MNKQIEIVQNTPLLDAQGNAANPGWCRRNLYVWDKKAVAKRLRWRVKEWDFFQVSDGRHMLQICFANISIGAAATLGYVDLQTGERVNCASINVATANRFALENNGDLPSNFVYRQNGVTLEIVNDNSKRRLYYEGKYKGQKVVADVTMYIQPELESITICTPFDKKGRFFLTQKQNCMPTQGTLTVGEQQIVWDSSNSYTVMDWGRGVWPYRNVWYWGNGSTVIDGVPFGFEITWGFGNESNATETALFWNGKCHKIGRVTIKRCPKEKGWMAPWEFTSEDGRFEMTMTPTFDNKSGCIALGLVGMKTHQVHGVWNGTVTLDDGRVLKIENMYAFCEYVRNAW